jgi:hydrogenase-4 component F
MALLFILLVPLVAFLGSLGVKRSLPVLGAIVISASFLELLAAAAVAVPVIGSGACEWKGYFFADPLGLILLMILALVGAMASWYSVGYLKMEMEKKIIGFSRVRQYFMLLHLFTLAMFFAVLTTSPLLMWIAIEGTTLSTAFLISFYNKPSSTEAAWKYLTINSVGLLLGFFGTLLFFYPPVHGGFQGLIRWQTLQAGAPAFDPSIARIAFVFVLIGFGTKVGLVPMHTWLPDAHSKAPAPISSLLSGVLLNVAFLAVLRFKAVADLAVGREFSAGLLIFFGLFSILVASFIIFIQKNYKRLLAYHSIEHMGIIALGFGFGGLGAVAGLLHMIYHALAKSALFLSAGNILLKYSSTKMHQVRGMVRTVPVTSILFFTGFLAMAGVPPFGIFITEFSILAAGIQGHLWAVILSIFSFALVFAGILKHVTVMVFGSAPEEMPKGEAVPWTVVPALLLLAVLVVLSFFIPPALQGLLQAAVRNL